MAFLLHLYPQVWRSDGFRESFGASELDRPRGDRWVLHHHQLWEDGRFIHASERVAVSFNKGLKDNLWKHSIRVSHLLVEQDCFFVYHHYCHIFIFVFIVKLKFSHYCYHYSCSWSYSSSLNLSFLSFSLPSSTSLSLSLSYFALITIKCS